MSRKSFKKKMLGEGMSEEEFEQTCLLNQIRLDEMYENVSYEEMTKEVPEGYVLRKEVKVEKRGK